MVKGNKGKAGFVGKIRDCPKELDEDVYWFELMGETLSASKVSSCKAFCDTKINPENMVLSENLADN